MTILIIKPGFVSLEKCHNSDYFVADVTLSKANKIHVSEIDTSRLALQKQKLQHSLNRRCPIP